MDRIEGADEATTFLLWALGLACLVYSLLPRFKFLGAFTAPVLFISKPSPESAQQI